jgi:hypothetical protein
MDRRTRQAGAVTALRAPESVSLARGDGEIQARHAGRRRRGAFSLQQGLERVDPNCFAESGGGSFWWRDASGAADRTHACGTVGAVASTRPGIRGGDLDR